MEEVEVRTRRTLPLTAEQMREMGLKYIIPSRYAIGSSSQRQEQTISRAENEQTGAEEPRSSGYVRARILEIRGRAEAILERRAQEAMAAEDRTVIAETEGAAAVRRLFERRHTEEAEAILERIARDMSAAAAAPSQP